MPLLVRLLLALAMMLTPLASAGARATVQGGHDCGIGAAPAAHQRQAIPICQIDGCCIAGCVAAPLPAVAALAGRLDRIPRRIAITAILHPRFLAPPSPPPRA